MSTLRVDNIKSRTGTAVTIPSGQSLDVTGDVNVTGNLAVTGSGNLNTTGIITATTFVGNITGVAATFTGEVTYEDVTNVDSVGIVTARGGFEIGASGVGGTITAVGNAEFAGITTAGGGFEIGAAGVGGTITSVGNAEFAGITTAGGGFRATTGGVEVTAGGLTITAGESYFGGGLSEKATIVANKLSAAANIDVSTGNVWYFSTNETTTGTPNLRWDGSTTLASKLATGDSVSVSIISKPNGAGYYAQMTIDGVAQTEEWNGGSAPAAANAGGYDITTYQILKTGSGTTDYIVLANVSNFA